MCNTLEKLRTSVPHQFQHIARWVQPRIFRGSPFKLSATYKLGGKRQGRLFRRLLMRTETLPQAKAKVARNRLNTQKSDEYAFDWPEIWPRKYHVVSQRVHQGRKKMWNTRANGFPVTPEPVFCCEQNHRKCASSTHKKRPYTVTSIPLRLPLPIEKHLVDVNCSMLTPLLPLNVNRRLLKYSKYTEYLMFYWIALVALPQTGKRPYDLQLFSTSLWNDRIIANRNFQKIL